MSERRRRRALPRGRRPSRRRDRTARRDGRASWLSARSGWPWRRACRPGQRTDDERRREELHAGRGETRQAIVNRRPARCPRPRARGAADVDRHQQPMAATARQGLQGELERQRAWPQRQRVAGTVQRQEASLARRAFRDSSALASVAHGSPRRAGSRRRPSWRSRGGRSPARNGAPATGRPPMTS